MPGISDFVKTTWSPRNIVAKAAAYTALISDEQINVTGAYTVTLFPLNSLQGTTSAKKVLAIKNTSTDGSLVTVQPGTNTVTNVADTIGERAVWTIAQNETLIISGNNAGTDWEIIQPYPVPGPQRAPFTKVVTTNGTTAVNIFDSDGAPENLKIDALLCIPLDATSKNITVVGGSSTISTIACSTSAAGSVIGPSSALTYPSVAKGDTLTVVSSAAAGNAIVIVIGTMQNYA